MPRSLLYSLLVFITAGIRFTSAAQTTFIALDTLTVAKGSRIFTDNLGNVFVVSPNNDIDKYSKDGKKTATQNFKVLGNIASLDVTNPFEIYVFYRDQGKVLFLDNMLSYRGEADLELAGFSQVAALARSYDNNIWLFDMADLKLKKLGKDLSPLLESNNLLPYVDTALNPSFILDNNQNIYVNNPGTGIMEFDVFANFNKTLTFDSLHRFQVFNGQFVYVQQNTLLAYDPKVFKEQVISLPLQGMFTDARIEKDRLYILRDTELLIFSY